MKKIAILLALSFVTSCFSTKYNISESKYNFDKVQAGTKYIIFDNQNRKFAVNVTSIEKDSIRGIRKNEPFAIAKNDIQLINRNNTGGTVILISGFAGVLIITAIISKAIGDVGKALTVGS